MSRLKKLIPFIICAAFLYVFVLAAWVGDDAYITLRTIDNFVNGYGLRWNIAERVQSFTHPLWLAAMLPVYIVSRNPYLTALLPAFFFSLATLILLLRRLPIGLALPALAALLVSKAFIDYSVSGLENPATHFLLAVFFFIFQGKEDWSARDILLMALTASLSLLSRIDSALFFAPALIYILYRQPSIRTVGWLTLGFTPFILWELFSLFYYGFLFPNTYYAKLQTGIPDLALMRQAFLYYIDSLERDPITLLTILLSLTLAFWRGKTRERLLAIGVSLYLIYILRIGGDFMSGRFFSAPLLISALLLTVSLRNNSQNTRATVSILFVLIGLLAPYPTFLPHSASQPRFTEKDLLTGIQDERGFYYSITGLPVVIANGWTLPASAGWVEHGIALRESGKSVVEENNIGFVGYYAGPSVHIVDVYALSDPLLARLPVPNPQKWRIGHYERKIPEGYLATLRTGENKLTNPSLASYYDRLTMIIRGPLWSTARIRAIWEMNTGRYNTLLIAGAQ